MGQKVRAKEACNILGISQNTIRRWETKGIVHPYREGKGNRRYDIDELRKINGDYTETEDNSDIVAIYCRVSSNDQKQHGDLDRQKIRIQDYCAKKKYKVGYAFDECGSGLNDKRPKLMKLMDLARDHKIGRVVVEHTDRLTRFNYNFLVKYFNSYNVAVEYAEETLSQSFEAELVKDMLSLITVFSAKLYGKRAKDNRARRKEGK